VNWYVEDHTAIVLSASENQFWRRGDADSLSPPHFFVRALDVSLGLTYRFSGWFAAPGFFPTAMAPPPVPQGQP
jgi:hypothetical protein